MILASILVILPIVFANTVYADTVHGTSDSDTILGTTEDDWIFALGGDDIIRFSSGTDFINGGTGFDVLDYSDSPVGIGIKMTKIGTIRVTSSTAFGPDNIVNNIESVIGTPLNDAFEGDSSDAFLIFRGGQGDDSFFKINSKNVFVSYSDASAGVLIDLAKGTATSASQNDSAGIGADTFRLINSLSIIGSNFDDRIIGNNGDNTIEGQSGNDFIDARGGDNIIDGGDGVDYCNYDPRGTTVTKNCEIINGVIQILDSDGDYIPDAIDECPFDRNKKTPGINGCGVSDACEFGTIQNGECINYHGGVTSTNVMVISKDTTANLEIQSDQALLISRDSSFTGNIKNDSGELFLSDDCTVFGNIESTEGLVSIQNCIITGNLIIDGGTLEMTNSTMKGTASVKNIQNMTVKNSQFEKNLDIVHGSNVSVLKNQVYQTLRVALSNNIEILENTIEHKFIVYGNDLISIIENSAKHLVTKYNTQCDGSGNIAKDKKVTVTC